MATKQKYTVGGVTVRATSEDDARRLATEVATEGNVPSTITSNDLAPATDAKITPPAPNSESANLLGALEQQTSNFQADLDRRAKQAEVAKEDSLGALLESQLTAKGEEELRSDAYSAKGGVDEIQTELTSIDQKLLEEQNALRRQVERIRKNPGGLLAGAIEDKVYEAESESSRKQADLSIIQMGIQGRYSDAKAIADRAIAVRLERDKNKNDALKLQYEDNKDLFTTAEQRAFETAQKDRDRALDSKEKDLQTISDLSIDALQNGAPSSIASAMRQAKTVEGAMRIGGQYVNALARRKADLEIQKLEAELYPKDGGEVFGGISPEDLPKLDGTSRNDLISDWTMTRSITRMQQLIDTVGLTGLVTGQGSPEAREYAQLKENIIDILARERTGAVIGKDEAKRFKKILGLGTLPLFASQNEQELKSIIGRTLPLLSASMDTVDPAGEWQTYLDAKYPSGDALADPLGLGISTTGTDPLSIF